MITGLLKFAWRYAPFKDSLIIQQQWLTSKGRSEGIPLISSTPRCKITFICPLRDTCSLLFMHWQHIPISLRQFLTVQALLSHLFCPGSVVCFPLTGTDCRSALHTCDVKHPRDPKPSISKMAAKWTWKKIRSKFNFADRGKLFPENDSL